MQITKEKKHTSFLPRLAVEMTIESLIEKLIPVSVVVQVCDNASAQYKCAQSFSDISQSPVLIIHAYFGEKHGKSFYNGFFGSHKQLITKYMQKKSETGSLPAVAIIDSRSFQHVSEALYGKKQHDERTHTAQSFIHIEKK